MRKQKTKERGMRITHCHRPEKKEQNVRVMPVDTLIALDIVSPNQVFHTIALQRGDTAFHIGGFVSEELRDISLDELRLAREEGKTTVRMPPSGSQCPCCQEPHHSMLWKEKALSHTMQ